MCRRRSYLLEALCEQALCKASGDSANAIPMLADMSSGFSKALRKQNFGMT
jgi:hypothetical protein